METNVLKEILTEALKAELIDTASPFQERNNAYYIQVWEYLERFSTNAGSQFFSAETLAQQTEAIAANFNIYHFVQSFFGRVCTLAASTPGVPDYKTLQSVLIGIHAQRYHIDSFLSSDRVARSTISVKDIEIILEGNPWYMMLWYLVMTGAYADVRKLAPNPSED